MATHRRKQDTPVIDTLFAKPYEFEFHQAIRILEHAYKQSISLGETNDPDEEVVKISSRIHNGFPPSDLESLKKTENDNQPKLEINFMGIAGLVGPLPDPYTRILIDRMQRRDYAFRDFLDIFNHRLASLHHRIRKKNHVGLTSALPENNLIGKCLADLIGIGTNGMNGRQRIPDRSFFYYAGLFWKQSSPAIALARMLEGYFSVPVEVEPFKGRWHYFTKDQMPIIGGPDHQNDILSVDAVLGTKCWVEDAMITVRIGPMPLEKFTEFLRDRDAYYALYDMTKLFIGINQDFVLNLVIDGQQIPQIRLGHDCQLGWTSWLKTKKVIATDDQVWVH